MHSGILGVTPAATLLWCLGSAPALAADDAAPCPAPQAVLAERFISADCADCWSRPPAGDRADGWVLDWIVPRTADAPLAAAALPEADDRLQRLAQPKPATQHTRLQPASAPLSSLKLIARAGPAWLGRTMAFEFIVQTGTALPPGSTGWLAMVEQLPAGAEGSPLPRALVRNLVGPLGLVLAQPGGEPLSHLRAMRWPEGADATRLAAYAWVEAADGRVLAMAADRCAVR